MIRQSVKMAIQFNGKILILPVNPESISIQRTASNEDIDIVGIGKATRKGEAGLINFTIESFFPGANSYFYAGNRPSECIKFINEIWETENINNNVAKIIVTGIPIPIDMYFVIDNFSYDHNAGDEQDIQYKLQIKKYIPYGVKLIETNSTTNTTVRTNSTNVETPKSNTKDKSYTVKSGDSLFAITKRYTGNGNKWRELYDLNKSKINNPNLIYPNQVLTIPSGW